MKISRNHHDGTPTYLRQIHERLYVVVPGDRGDGDARLEVRRGHRHGEVDAAAAAHCAVHVGEARHVADDDLRAELSEAVGGLALCLEMNEEWA